MESWTNPSILQFWLTSKGSIKHQHGSLCQASLPGTGGAGQEGWKTLIVTCDVNSLTQPGCSETALG